jgi:excisionase family DNA binding protein
MGVTIRHNSIPEAAKYLNKTVAQVEKLIKDGEIESIKLGGIEYVCLDVITEGRAPRRYEPHKPKK